MYIIFFKFKEVIYLNVLKIQEFQFQLLFLVFLYFLLLS